jgi:hypothetical protein
MGVSKSTKDDENKFSGELGVGCTHTEFDRTVVSYVLEEYGGVWAKQFWEDTLLDISAVDMSDPEQEYDFHRHCHLVHGCISTQKPKHANELFVSDYFWTPRWQLDWRARQYELLFVYVSSICKGEALRQVVELGSKKAHMIRSHFMSRFGGSESAIVRAREKAYTAGMPGTRGIAFPDYCNMEAKLNELETERTYFWDLCPASCRSTYAFCTERKLVAVVMEHLPPDYDACVQEVRNMLKLRKMIGGDESAGVTTSTDLTLQLFSEDWLPPWPELRTALIDRYHALKKDGHQSGKARKVFL